MEQEQPLKKTRPGLIAAGLIAFVRCYQIVLAPIMAGQCRFRPTCSNYSIQALQTHGALRGTWLTIYRILRCQPWGGHGDDPVPGHERCGTQQSTTSDSQ